MSLDVLRELYERHNAVGAEFPDLLGDYLHPDVEFVEFADSPSAATYRGRDAVVELFRNRFEAGSMWVDDIQLIALDDGRVLAAFSIRMRGALSGAETSMRLWNLVTFDGARIARLEEFNDQQAALTAAGRSLSP